MSQTIHEDIERLELEKKKMLLEREIRKMKKEEEEEEKKEEKKEEAEEEQKERRLQEAQNNFGYINTFFAPPCGLYFFRHTVHELLCEVLLELETYFRQMFQALGEDYGAYLLIFNPNPQIDEDLRKRMCQDHTYLQLLYIARDASLTKLMKYFYFCQSKASALDNFRQNLGNQDKLDQILLQQESLIKIAAKLVNKCREILREKGNASSFSKDVKYYVKLIVPGIQNVTDATTKTNQLLEAAETLLTQFRNMKNLPRS